MSVNLRWINTGNFYKCYDDSDGEILGAVRESDDKDGTYVIYVLGQFAGEYVTQQAGVAAVEQSIKNDIRYN
jgi:hypothetical protein